MFYPVWANCITERDVGLMPTDPFAMIRLLNVPPVYVDSNSTVMGKAARHFRFTLTMTAAAAADILSGGNTTLVWPIGTTLVVLDYYDSMVTHFPLRLTAASVFDNWAPPVIIDIVSFTPDAKPATAWPGPSPKVDGTFDAAISGNLSSLTSRCLPQAFVSRSWMDHRVARAV